MFPAFHARVVQPIHYESASFNEEDIICRGSDDEELLPGQRARKRRRIEEKGNQYLAGEGHFILTAGLRGPFDKGWQNPWASTRRKRTVEGIRPEDGVQAKRLDQGRRVDERGDFRLSRKNGLVNGGTTYEDQTVDKDQQMLAPSRESKRYRSLDPSSRPPKVAGPSARSSPIRATEDWLRTKDTNRQTPHVHRTMSPTPTPAPKQRPDSRSGPSRHHTRSRDGSLTSLSVVKSLRYPPENSAAPDTSNVAKHRDPGNQMSPGIMGEKLAEKDNADYVKSASLSRHNLLQQRSPKPFRHDREAAGKIVNVAPHQRPNRAEHEIAAVRIGAAVSFRGALSPKTSTCRVDQEKNSAAKQPNNAKIERESRRPVSKTLPASTYQAEFSYDVHQRPQSKDEPNPLPCEVATDYISVSSGSSSTSSSDDEVLIPQAEAEADTQNDVHHSSFAAAVRDMQSKVQGISTTFKNDPPITLGNGPSMTFDDECSSRPRIKACSYCRKHKRRCIHDGLGNEEPAKYEASAVPRLNARKTVQAVSPVQKHAMTPSGNDLKAIPAAARRLTFTPNGGSQLQDSRPPSRSNEDVVAGGNADAAVVDPRQAQGPSRLESKSTKTSSKSSQKPLSYGERSKESSNILPEAQVREEPQPLRAPVTRSSTNLLETDKQPLPSPVFVEEDSYMNLATQAAMEKARRRLDEDIVADLAKSAHGADVAPNGLTEQITQTPKPRSDLPLSTQAMMDEMSPFDISTIKKPAALRRKPNPVVSPIKAPSPSQARSTGPAAFPSYSPNMSTSSSSSSSRSAPASPTRIAGEVTHEPARSQASIYMSAPSLQSKEPKIVSHSHPSRHRREREQEGLPPLTLSPLISFSIQPDGTLTETRLQQDGQQAYPMLVPEESYTPLPSLDFDKPLRSTANTSNGNDHNRDKGASKTNNQPKSGHRASSRSTPTKRGPHISDSSTGAGAAPPYPPTPKKAEEETDPLGNDANASSDSANGDDDAAPARNPEWLLQANVSESSANTQDREIEAFIEDAGSFLSDWNVEGEAKRLRSATKREKEKERGFSAGGGRESGGVAGDKRDEGDDEAVVKGILSSKKGKGKG